MGFAVLAPIMGTFQRVPTTYTILNRSWCLPAHSVKCGDGGVGRAIVRLCTAAQREGVDILLR
jgi:hypothetical protein